MPVVNRRILPFVLLLVFLLASSAEALEMNLMQGAIKKGTISFAQKKGIDYAALDEMLSGLGFAPTPMPGGLVVVFSGRKIEFWDGSNVARVNGAVYPLPDVVYQENGHFWGEANSSLKAISSFLASAGRPADISWANVGASPATTTAASAPVTAAPAPPVSKPPAVSEAGRVKISAVRWGEQPDAYRAVVDLSEQTEVTFREVAGRVEIIFKESSSALTSATSPWSSLSVESKASGQDTVLSFKHNAAKVNSFWLTDPPRYVVDFHTSGSSVTSIVTTPTEQRQPDPIPPVVTPTPVAPTPIPPQMGGGKWLVVVDAGHGGHDPGAVANRLREKDINLKAAHELSASLKKLGLEVRLTRADDRYLKLEERTRIANETNASVFISLHCNALPKGKHASGVELYLMAEPSDKDALNLAVIENRELANANANNAEANAASDKKTQLLLKILGDMQQNDKINESTTLAEHLYDKTRANGFSLRKVRQAPFFVLRGAGMPAILVEMGYLTEASDAKLLNTQSYRIKMMDSLAAGILEYLKGATGEGGRG